LGFDSFIEAQLIFTYVSYKDEVDTIALINYAINHKKRIAVPKIISLEEGMVAIEIKSIEELKENSLGILEPVDFKNQINPSEIDFSIVPGLAFDRKGGRLGYGGGFYDRFLSNLSANANIVALAYDFQIVDTVPCEQHDIKIREVITN